MILISKLSNKYPIADLKYLSGEKDGIDPIFAGRLSALARDERVNITINSGYRSRQEQERIYNLYKIGELKSASRPGFSWHEFRLAVDTSTQPIRAMDNDQLKPYGLCKPLSAEGWHIQPIETSGELNRERYEPLEEEEVIYKTYKEIPVYAAPTIKKLMDKKVIVGDAQGNINLSDDMVRIFVVHDRLGIYK